MKSELHNWFILFILLFLIVFLPFLINDLAFLGSKGEVITIFIELVLVFLLVYFLSKI